MENIIESNTFFTQNRLLGKTTEKSPRLIVYAFVDENKTKLDFIRKG